MNVLQRIYCCIFIECIVTNGCMSITKDLLLYYIEWNCHGWLYEHYERSTVVLLIVNYHEWWCEYYEGSIVVLYWTFTIVLYWMKLSWMIRWVIRKVLLCYTECKTIMECLFCITKDLSLCYWMLNYYGMLVRAPRRVCYYVAVNVKLLWIVG